RRDGAAVRRGRGGRSGRGLGHIRRRTRALCGEHRRAAGRRMTELAARNRFVATAEALAEGSDAMAIPLDGKVQETLVDPQPAPGGEVVEPGRALAIADFAPPHASLGERMMRLAYRLGIPGPTLVAPFRKPARPRLLAT